MKLVPIIMDYCLLQFDALKIFLGVRLHGGSQPNFNYFNVNPQIFQRNRKVPHTNCLEINFHNISNKNFFPLNISGVDEINMFFILCHLHHKYLRTKFFVLKTSISYNSYV